MRATSSAGSAKSTVEIVLPILDEAADELDAAVEYLEARREGSGRSLLEDFDRKLDQILMFPDSGSLVADAPNEYMIRSFPLLRFGYSILVGSIHGVPTIIAFIHQSREPGYWRLRLNSYR